MKIRKIQIKNYLGIEELEINVNSDKVLIEGGNGKGKTSILEAIENTLNSTASRRPQKVSIGADQSLLLLELDDGTEIKRTIQGENSKVEIKKDGNKMSSPETYLKSLFNGFSFNPIDFLQKKDKEQTAILLRLLPFQITPQDAKEWFGEVPNVNYEIHGLLLLNLLAEDYFYNKRAVANKDVKDIENQIKALNEQIPLSYNYKEWETVNTSEVYNEISKANDHNDKLNQASIRISEIENILSQIEIQKSIFIEDLQEFEKEKTAKLYNDLENSKTASLNEISKTENEIIQLEKLIEQKKQHIKEVENDIENYKAFVENEKTHLKETIELKKSNFFEKKKEEETNLKKESADLLELQLTNNQIEIDELLEKAKHIENMKSFILLAKNREGLKGSLSVSVSRANHLDSLVEFCRQKPKEIIAQAKMPIDGLGINEQGNITINDIPIKNLSTSEQLNLAIEIAKATSGDLKIICVDKFESMDNESKEMFLNKTKDDGYTYFITQVSTGELKINQGK